MELEQAIIVYAIVTSITIIYLILRTRYIQNTFERYINDLNRNISSERIRTLTTEIDILVHIKETLETISEIQTDLKKAKEDSLKRDIQIIKRI